MVETNLNHFEASKSSIKNRKLQVKNSFNTTVCYYVATVAFALMAFGGILYILKPESRRSNFDELITTGGAVRRSVEESRKNCSGIVLKKCKTKACQNFKTYVENSMAEKCSVEDSILGKCSFIDPCENFYKYACNGWIKKNPIPKTSSTFSTFSKLNQKVESILHKILKSNIKEEGMMRNVKNFYHSCENLQQINKIGKTPMINLIKYLNSWDLARDDSWNKEKWNFTHTLLKIHTEFTSSGGPLVSIHVSDDPRASTKHILEIDQAGPSLPREIYLSKDPKKLETLKAYTEYLVNVSHELCKNNTVQSKKCKKDIIKRKARETVEFERRLAQISVPDDVKQESWFRRMTLKELEKAVPDFPWYDYLNQIFSNITSIRREEYILVPALDYLKKMMTLVSRTNRETLSNYVVWSVIQDEVPYLSQPFLDIRMRYKERVLGSKGLRKRWKTCVSYTNEYLGEILGKLYKDKNFKESAKITAEHMIKNIRKAFQANVNTLSWMDEVTKKKVGEKAAAMKDQVGYPSYIANKTRFEEKYKNLKIYSNRLFQNRINMIKFAHSRMLNKIRKPVDKEEWPMDPQTINAMYSFNQNGMIIPAGILQPPFFHGENLSMAMTYGAIGSILGHELTHGFDNTGRKFNKHGELKRQWWSNASLAAFKEKSQCMIDQYNKYKVRGKYQINGKLTLGENIADNGGFKTAFRAYNDWLCENKADNLIDGLKFDNNQLFFIAFAQAYCSNSRENEQYLATLNDRHSEEEFRVIGTLSNSKEFSGAFGCKLGTRMNPKKKCSVWINENTER